MGEEGYMGGGCCNNTVELCIIRIQGMLMIEDRFCVSLSRLLVLLLIVITTF